MIMNVFFYCCGNHLQYNHNNSVSQMVVDIVVVVPVLQMITNGNNQNNSVLQMIVAIVVATICNTETTKTIERTICHVLLLCLLLIMYTFFMYMMQKSFPLDHNVIREGM